MIGDLLRVRYELVQELGDGTIFTAYLARDRASQRDVCVRVLKEPFNSEPEFVRRLGEVAERARRINHLNVERVYNFEEHHGRWFLVTEYVAGGSQLGERVKRLASFAVPSALEVVIAVCEGLQAIHEAGMVHGDIGAHQVLAPADGSVKIIQAGIWETYAFSATAGMAMLPRMSPYLAPEVTAGSMPSVQSDVYATGCLIYLLLSGHYPYPAANASAMAAKHLSSPYPGLRPENPSVPAVLDEIVRKAMSKAPGDRYDSARALAHDLKHVRDALRFGRVLTWPIEPGKEPEPAPAVTPKMSAVRPPQKADKLRQQRDEEWDGLPRWVTVIFWICCGAALLLGGAYLFTNFNRPANQTVPQLVGLTEAQAREKLGELNLRMALGGHEPSEEIPEGSVIRISPLPGNEVRRNSAVTVVLSTGSEFVDMPDLTGATLADARNTLAGLGVEVAEPPVEDRNAEGPPGTVVSHKPAAGDRIQRGSRVDLTITARTRRPAPTAEPDDEPAANSSRYRYFLSVQMPEELERRVRVRVEMEDSDGTRTVHNRFHDPGEEVDVEATGAEKQATFRIYFNDELVDTQEAEAR